jgi:glycosyltransferase involved in cell wall biosynthesis
MKIGFESKRVFENTTGLGNATRGIINAMLTYFPENEYHLFAPKQSDLFITKQKYIIHQPNRFLHKKLSAIWRANWMVQDIEANNIDVFIGLAGELPIGLQKLNCKKIVFVHDVIFERYPNQYNVMDVNIYRRKTKHACKIADVILVNSTATKNDLITFYNIDANKIAVVYLDCDTAFYATLTAPYLHHICTKYNLPKNFFLNVGSIIQRKNLHKIGEAYTLLPSDFPPLVVIGNGKNSYATSVENYIAKNNLQHKIIFLNKQSSAQDPDFKNSTDFPAIYQSAIAMLYPSVFEGFGLPILEAMASGLPVITSNVSCMPEIGGNAAMCINTASAKEIATAMQSIFTDKNLSTKMKQLGYTQAQQFSAALLAKRIMKTITT